VIPIGRKGFQKKLGWNTNVCVPFIHLPAFSVKSRSRSQHVFETLGFKLDEVPPTDTGDTGPALFPPHTSSATLEGRQNRDKLLRAWVEISAWLFDYLKRQGRHCLVVL
jgi:ubiquitin carboxyl-terminal hydrolase 25/28